MWLSERDYRAISRSDHEWGPLLGFIIWQLSEKISCPNAPSALLLLAVCVFVRVSSPLPSQNKSAGTGSSDSRSQTYLCSRLKQLKCSPCRGRRTRWGWEGQKKINSQNTFLNPPAHTSSAYMRSSGSSLTFKESMRKRAGHQQLAAWMHNRCNVKQDTAHGVFEHLGQSQSMWV